VTVGGGGGGTTTPPPSQSQSDTVTVYGLVYDSNTNNPISGVSVFILTAGTTYDQWAGNNYSDKYIVASLKTAGNGKYKITGIPRNTQFTIVFSVQGYFDKYGDNLTVSSSDPAEFEMNVGMNK
jgi:hypothetical protein